VVVTAVRAAVSAAISTLIAVSMNLPFSFISGLVNGG
jgi:hypothetical protein